jgi:hypothetical protein
MECQSLLPMAWSRLRRSATTVACSIPPSGDPCGRAGRACSDRCKQSGRNWSGRFPRRSQTSYAISSGRKRPPRGRDELRIECASLLGWTGGLVLGILDQVEAAAVATALPTGARQVVENLDPELNNVNF